MIKICHIEGRRSERIVWLLEEIGGVEYALDFISGDILGSLLRLEETHEMRMTPIIQDGDLVMIESSAILEYLLIKYAKGSALRPTEDSVEFPYYLQFLHFAEGTAMSKILLEFARKSLREAADNKSAAPQLPGLAGSRSEAERIIHFAENTLSRRRYFAGDTFTAADIMMLMPVRMAAASAGKSKLQLGDLYNSNAAFFDVWPNAKRFVTDVTSRSAYQRTLKATMPNGPPAM